MKSQSLDLFSLEKKTNDVLKQIFVNGRPHRVVFQGRNPSISSFVSPFSIRGCLFALPFSNGCNCRRPGIPGSSGECRCRHISVSACYNYLKVKKRKTLEKVGSSQTIDWGGACSGRVGCNSVCEYFAGDPLNAELHLIRNYPPS